MKYHGNYVAERNIKVIHFEEIHLTRKERKDGKSMGIHGRSIYG